MNREILFRGKRVTINSNNGEWVVGFLVTGIHTTWIFTGDVNSSGLYPSWGKIVVDPETVGQFTGLVDKNGNRIFEGDILTSDEYPFQDEGKRNYDAIVEWIEYGWQVVLTCVNPDKRGISEGMNSSFGEREGYSFQVTGNIHDNT